MCKKLLLLVLLLNCGYQFPTSYEKIETNKVRPVAIICDYNGLAEGSPLDTLILHAHFGGDQINNVDWFYLCKNVKTDTLSLQQIMVPGSYKQYSGTNTDSFNFTIVIPDSFIRNEFKDKKSLKEIIPVYMHGQLSRNLLNKSPNEVLDFLEKLCSYNSNVGILYADSLIQELTGDSSVDAGSVMPVLLQVFTVPLKIYVIVNDLYKMEYSVTVRYNNKLGYLGAYITVNNNPKINSIRLYEVKGEKKTFNWDDFQSVTDTFYNIPVTDTIRYKKGYSYFLAVLRNSNPIDTGMSFSGIRGAENFNCEWFLNNGSTPENISHIYLTKSMSRSSIVKVNLPSDLSVGCFTVWCVLYDYYLGERLRPVGFDMRCGKIAIVSNK